MNRPTFYYRDDRLRPIRAVGILYYRVIDKKLEFLMIRCNDEYSDFGGKTDESDDSPYAVAAREAAEESNGIFNQQKLLTRLKPLFGTYHHKTKYLVYVIKTTKNYDPKLFGTVETHDNLNRTVEWVTYEQIFADDFPIHPRLHFTGFYNRLRQVAKKNEL